MSIKKTWKEWSIDYIIKNNRCPGNILSFELLDNKITYDEFNSIVKSSGDHEYNDCHFIEDILGINIDPNNVKEIIIDEEDKLKNKIGSLDKDVKEVSRSKQVAKLKENLHLYIDRIHFKDNGSLSVPDPLLKIREYINAFFQ